MVMAPLVLAALLALHPGHGSLALVGTLVAVGAESISVEVRDLASPTPTRRDVAITADTRVRLGRQTVTALADWIGAAVVVTVDYEEGVDGRTVYTADKVQITPPRPKPR